MREVSFRSFRLSRDHLEDAVEIGRDLFRYYFLHLGESVVKVDVNVILERVSNLFTPLMEIFTRYLLLVSVFVKNAVVQLVYVICLLLNTSLNLGVRNAICSTHSERVSN